MRSPPRWMNGLRACTALAWIACGCAPQIVQLAAGRDATCARLRSGEVRCWGENPYGKLGVGDADRDHPTARAVVGLTDAVHVAVGQEHACAVRATGAVVCWGANQDRELGDGKQHPSHEPVEVRGLTGARAVAAGNGFTCAQLADGRARCWGANGASSLGDGTLEDRSGPVEVTGLVTTAQLVTEALAGHVCARRVTGQVVCWGNNNEEELGRVEDHAWGAPAPVQDPLLEAVEIAVGGAHTCARLASGRVACWGANNDGQLGDGTRDRRADPAPVADLTDAVELAAGAFHTCARRQSGAVVCWGANDHGQLGRPSDSQLHARPEQVPGLNGALELALGESHSCARLSNAVVCWGANQHGQLGDGALRDRVAPAPVVGLER